MNGKSIKALTVSIFVTVNSFTWAQSAHVAVLSNDEKSADFSLLSQQFAKAEKEYKAIISKKDTNRQAQARSCVKLASMFYSTHKYDEAELYFEQASSEIEQFSTEQAVNFVNTLIQVGNYYRATDVIEKFAASPLFSKDTKIKNLKSGLETMSLVPENPEYNVEIAPFNKKGSNIWACSYQNGTLLINTGEDGQEIVKGAKYYFLDGTKEEAYTKIPLIMQAGPLAISTDGKTVIYTDNYYNEKAGKKFSGKNVLLNHLQLVQATYNGKKDKWEEPTSVFNSGSSISYCHPSISEDGTKLYFSSNREGGLGKMDLYMAKKVAEGWGEPINLGKVVNTNGDELFPTVRGDELTFSSNAHNGFGGFDVYKVKLSEYGFPIGETLEHFPYPINSVYDDYAYTYINDTSGYFTSSRSKETGFQNIYSWTKSANAQPKATKEIEVAVSTDAINMANELISNRIQSDATLYFGYNKYNLSPETLINIDLFHKQLENKTPRLLLLGYADTTGDQDYNRLLSEMRAQEVKKYLVEVKNYPAEQIDAIGKGHIKLLKSQELQDDDIKIRLAPARKVDIKLLDTPT